MKGLRQFGSELAAIVKNRKVLIPVIAILMVPVLYSGLFLGAFWDPYGKMDELPVAVVNSDAGAEMEGKQLAIGEEFIQKLKDNPKFKWDFVDKETAEQGLEENRYYMAIEIPENFSQQATTLTSDHPSPAVIRYLPNESLNFLSAQIGNTAVETMKAQLNKEVTKEYARTIFDQVTELADGLGDASDGASKINDGTVTANDGAATIASNLAKLSEGSATMKDGVSQLTAGSAKLEKGAGELNDGMGSLAAGLKQLTVAEGQLQDGADQAGQGAKQLEEGLKQAAAGSSQVATGAEQLSDSLEQYAAAVPGLADDENFKKLIAASKQVAAGAKASADGQQKLKAGAATLNNGLDSLSTGLTTFGTKLNEASDGGQKLVVGAGSLEKGATDLHGGLNKLSAGAATVADGSSQLATGADQLSSGLAQLTDGTGELSSKLSEAADATSSLNAGDELFDMFASPIDVETVVANSVPNYGTGFAPYFVSLGLFVGALLLTIVFSVREPAVQPANGWSWFISKLLVLIAVGLIQTVIVDAVLLLGLNMEVTNVGQFFLFSFITSITFMSLIQFLVTVFDQPGRFIAIVVLIFQLTTSAGTFPLELIPNWMQSFNAWLPMSYSVSGFKDVISSGDTSALWSNAGILLVFFAVFSVLTLAYFVIAHRKQAQEGQLASA
ncbi:YhgE/Pip domain-containing protein [Paenibacillus sp. NEAU-GSW1]|uniref:YhgE/Pip domain-containing protein n=1 Tax=Paenibacillus sp. NEAU-GSW1 TaxID=2682486 RepID=UPI0012E164F4|nr:YhgE/Pip domain-containing protein [Paenibacillus sp. NEAU-GSW1]MUT67743.1 DUF3533 domain-containing protein [Paenibacillus sp. NEAU-GSW1]